MKKQLLIFLTIVLILTCSKTSYASKYTNEAEELKKLNLFNGSNVGFELDRAPTRVEAAAMLVKFLGKEETAKQNKYSHPFKDIPTWASDYVGYLYQNEITKGINSNTFGSNNTISSQDFTVFILKSLGYNSSDFSYKDTLEFAQQIGLMQIHEKDSLKDKIFLRDDMVHLAYNALSTKLKNSTSSLKDTLVTSNTIEPKKIEITSDPTNYEIEIIRAGNEMISYKDDFLKFRIEDSTDLYLQELPHKVGTKYKNKSEPARWLYFTYGNKFKSWDKKNLVMEIKLFKDNSVVLTDKKVTVSYNAKVGGLNEFYYTVSKIDFDKLIITFTPIENVQSNSNIKVTHISKLDTELLAEKIKSEYAFLQTDRIVISQYIPVTDMNTWLSELISIEYEWNNAINKSNFLLINNLSTCNNYQIEFHDKTFSSMSFPPNTSENVVRLKLGTTPISRPRIFVLYDAHQAITEILVIE